MGRRQQGGSQTDGSGKTTLAGLQRQHEGKNALSNWRSPPRPVAKSGGKGEMTKAPILFAGPEKEPLGQGEG